MRIFIKNANIKFNISSFLFNEFNKKNNSSLNFDFLINKKLSEIPNFLFWHLEEKKGCSTKNIEFFIKMFLNDYSFNKDQVCDHLYLMLYKSKFNNNFNTNIDLQLKSLNKRIIQILLNKKKSFLFDFSINNKNIKLLNNSTKLLKTNLNSLNEDILNLKIENSFIRFYFRDFFKYYFFKIFLKSYIFRI